jgi:hypothetical protein
VYKAWVENTPKKWSKKAGDGEDQPSPKLEMMGGIKMVGDECKELGERL